MIIRYLHIVVVFMLPSLVLGANSGITLRDPANHFFDQSLGDLQEELVIAREQGKQGVLLFFEMDECPFCHRMKQDVLNHSHVQDFYRKHFRVIQVDIEGDVLIQDFKGEDITQKDFAFAVNRVRATPVFLFYDLTGEPVVRYTGATSGIDEFLWLGEYVVEKIYRDMPFTKYKRQKRKQARKW